jgi:hypothetical protein
LIGFGYQISYVVVEMKPGIFIPGIYLKNIPKDING